MKYLKIGSDLEVKEVSESSKKKINFDFGRELIAQSLNLGFYLVTPILLGAFLGLYLDRLFDRKPVFTLIFIFLGTIASFYNLIKIVRSEK